MLRFERITIDLEVMGGKTLYSRNESYGGDAR